VHIIGRMGDENKPNPLDDVTKGLGLLFRAAKTTVERLPTEKIEDVVTEGAKEVGRAIETVGGVIEREILGKKPGSTPPGGSSSSAGSESASSTSGTSGTSGASSASGSSAHPQDAAAPAEESGETDPDAPKGPRIA
jgi:hypothetical protein